MKSNIGKVLVVVDMQNDFLTGTLANEEGCRIVPKLKALIEKEAAEGAMVVFTRDTHHDDYLNTQEGKLLPVEHCIKGTKGHEITPELAMYATSENTIDKLSFGCLELGSWIYELLGETPEEIILTGVCTDICVISNAMILKAAFPETPIRVIGSCCAGVTVESHETALKAMAASQIFVE